MDKDWRMVVMSPSRLLIWLNTAAATACFALILYWAAFGWLGQALAWAIQVAAVGGFLSLVAFVGSWLERR